MVIDVVDGMRAAVDVVANVDLDQLGDQALDEELIGLLHERHRLDAQIARRVQRWEARSVWTSDGSRSPAARLSRDALVSKGTAQ